MTLKTVVRTHNLVIESQCCVAQLHFFELGGFLVGSHLTKEEFFMQFLKKFL